MRINKYKKGYTLMEVLVVIAVFSILGLVVTGVVATTLRSSGKSENTVIVRENVSYAMGVMERQLRNAEELDCSASSDTQIVYRNSTGNVDQTFTCNVVSGIGRIESTNPAGNITNSDISVDCSVQVFNCVSDDVVNIFISATDARSVGNANALTTDYSESVSIQLRNY